MRRRDKAGLKASRRRTASTRRDTKKSRRRRNSSNSREAEVARLTGELAETREQQTATSDVLKVISTSKYELQTVFETLVESATRLCHANASAIWRWASDEMYHLAASCGLAPDFQSRLQSLALRADGRSVVGRCLQAGKTVYVPNLVQDQEFAKRQTTDFGGYRGLLCVPLQRDDLSVGVLMVAHKTVRKFTPQQIALVENFAAQAVIAIENARLLNELRQRTNDLSESLEQQTATSEVLKVISSSASDLQAVFDTMAENAVRLCEAERAFIFRFDGQLLHAVASYNAGPEIRKFIHRNPIAPGRYSISARAALERRTVHVADVQADPEYAYANRDVAPIRTILSVPMLKGDDLVGTITIYRLEVKPFTDKQVALVETFADQAVIAIENTRLLNELRESLQRQTATADVLKVISRSTFDLQVVLDALVESAARLCEV